MSEENSAVASQEVAGTTQADDAALDNVTPINGDEQGQDQEQEYAAFTLSDYAKDEIGTRDEYIELLQARTAPRVTPEAERIQRLEQTIQQMQVQPQQSQQQQIAKPTLDSCDWQEDKFEQQMSAYLAQQRAQQAQPQSQQGHIQGEQAAQPQAQTQAGYLNHQQINEGIAQHYDRVSKAGFNASDYIEAEKAAVSALNPQVTSAIQVYMGNESPALMYAIGKSPKHAAKLNSILAKKPVLLGPELGRMAERLQKVDKRSSAPAPENQIEGGGSGGRNTAVSTVQKKIDESLKKGGSVDAYRKAKAEAAAQGFSVVDGKVLTK